MVKIKIIMSIPYPLNESISVQILVGKHCQCPSVPFLNIVDDGEILDAWQHGKITYKMIGVSN